MSASISRRVRGRKRTQFITTRLCAEPNGQRCREEEEEEEEEVLLTAYNK